MCVGEGERGTYERNGQVPGRAFVEDVGVRVGGDWVDRGVTAVRGADSAEDFNRVERDQAVRGGTDRGTVLGEKGVLMLSEGVLDSVHHMAKEASITSLEARHHLQKGRG